MDTKHIWDTEQRDKFLRLLGELKTVAQALKAGELTKYGYNQTCLNAPEFQAQVNRVKQTWCDPVEEKLIEKATEGGVEIRETWVTRRDGQGQPVFELDDEGMPTIPSLYLSRREVRKSSPDTHAQLVFLRSRMPEIYGDKVEITENETNAPTDPEAVKLDLAARIKAIQDKQSGGNNG